MNIYFACSITGGRQNEKMYQSITSFLLNAGHIVPTSHLAESNVVNLEQVVDARDVYNRDVNWINHCDVLVAEISTPSHGVGYEIGFALSLNKPVLCLYKEGLKISKMITGNPNERLTIIPYTGAEDALTRLQTHLKRIKILL